MASKEKKPTVSKDDSALQDLARRFRANPFVFIGTVVILLLTVVAFVLVPALAPEAGQGGGKLSFGSYDGVSIDFIPGNYFAQQRDYYSEQYRASGNDLDVQFAAFQIWRAAFESTVIRTAALQEMKAAGYATPAKVVDRRMAELPVFQENGRFSAARYRAMPDAERMALRNDLHDQVAMELYMEDMLGLRVSSKEKEFMKALSSPERSFAMVSFPAASYPNSEVAAFIESNPDLFKIVHLSKISIGGAESDAKKILDSIKGGTSTFEDAAKTHSKDEYADKGGDLGVRYAFEFATDIPDAASRAAVLSLGKGELSVPVKVPTGWAIFRAEEAVRQGLSTDPAALAKARAYIAGFERGRLEDWLIAKAEAFARQAETQGFEAAAAAMGLEAKTFGPLPLNYGEMELYRTVGSFSIPELSGAATNDAFWKAAFATPLQRPSKPVVIGESVIVLNPTEQRAADEAAGSIIDIYYPYIVGQYSEGTVRNFFLSSKKLKDNFFETFIKTFLSQN